MSRHRVLPGVSSFKPVASLGMTHHQNGDVLTPTAGHNAETLQVRNSQRIHELMKYLTGEGKGEFQRQTLSLYPDTMTNALAPTRRTYQIQTLKPPHMPLRLILTSKTQFPVPVP